MAEIKVGLVGLGRFGQLHARVLSELPGCRLSALCEVDAPTLGRCGREFGVGALYADLESMLGAEELDAVDLVTDESAHGAQARLCLEHGCAVFVEKPLATDWATARTVSALAERTWLPVVVGNISRFDARYALLRRELEAGRFGRVTLVSAKRNFSRAWFTGFGSRVHPVFESMIHDLDLALWYLPAPVRRVYARSATSADVGSVPDVVAAILTAAYGSLAVLQSSWLLPDGAPVTLPGPPANPLDLWGTIDARLEVVGTTQVGRVDLLAGGPELWDASRSRVPETGLWPEVHGHVGGALREELKHFLDCVRAKEPSPIAPPQPAVVAVGLAEAIVRSAQEGRPIDVAETGEPL